MQFSNPYLNPSFRRLYRLVPRVQFYCLPNQEYGEIFRTHRLQQNREFSDQFFLEPDTEGEKKIANKVDAYKREQEEAARKKSARGKLDPDGKLSDEYKLIKVTELNKYWRK